MESFVLVIEGLDNLDTVEALTKKLPESLRRAVNAAATLGRKRAADEVLKSVNLPADYVAPRNHRLEITRYATRSNAEAVISARSRNTSLARFAQTSYAQSRASRAGVSVEVTPGSVKRMQGAFLIKLKAGKADLDTKSNLGLAVRTKDGRPPPGYKPVQLAKNLWLLYGPSVAQILHSDKNAGGVATDISPEIADKLETEFFRQMGLE